MVQYKNEDNQLESGSYTSIFEIFVIGDAGSFRVDDTIIYQTYGDSHYTINTFDGDKIDSQYTKSIFNSLLMEELEQMMV